MGCVDHKIRGRIELKYVASADVKLENISGGNPLYRREWIDLKGKKEKSLNALQISNESFEFLFEEIYSRESLALKEFPELEGLDNDSDSDNDDDDSGTDDDDDDDDDGDCSL